MNTFYHETTAEIAKNKVAVPNICQTIFYEKIRSQTYKLSFMVLVGSKHQ